MYEQSPYGYPVAFHLLALCSLFLVPYLRMLQIDPQCHDLLAIQLSSC